MNVAQEERTVTVGGVYKHFKGTHYKVLYIARHSETKEKLVIYQSMTTQEVWARPVDMFLSEVDHEKYPDISQKYRFQLDYVPRSVEDANS